MYTRFGACNLWGNRKQGSRKAQRYIVIFFVLVMLVSGALPSRAGSSQPQSVTVTNPSGPVAFGETPEYATWVWNDPWDMSDPLDVQQLDSPRCAWPNHFSDYSSCSSGIWCGRVRPEPDASDPDLFLLHPGYRSTVYAGRTGQLRPIDADYYTQLTFRMYIDSVDPGDPGWQVVWTDGTVADIGADPSRYGSSHLFKTYSGWHIYTVDLSIYRNSTPPSSPGRRPWAGQLTGFRLDPGLVNMNNKVVMLDWVRLTPRQVRPISWLAAQSGSIKILLQSSAGTDELHMYTIRSCCGGVEWTEPLNVSASPGSGSFDLPASLPPGDWYVRLNINGEVSAAAGPWRVQQAPTLRFLKPGYTSGQDFAQTVLRNAWDMNDPGDIYSYANTTPPVFSGGVLASTSIDSNPLNTCSGYWEDPQIILLNGNGAIDTSKYRYLTYRLKLDGVPDVSYGWAARVSWAGPQDCGITNDAPLHAGWNEVSIDLWDANILEPEAQGCQSPWRARSFRQYLRLDPLESPEAVTFYVDSVMLTANDTASRGSVFEIRYELNKSEDVVVTFYYDADRNPANGRFSAVEYMPPSNMPPTGPHLVYIPFVLKPLSNTASGQVFLWDLTNVAPGTYYISADVDDGYNRTTWYSEAPVIVTE